MLLTDGLTDQDILNKYLGDRTPFYKEAASVVHIIAFLAKKLLDRKGVDFDECAQDIVRWLDRFAKDRPIQDVTLARELLSLHICLCAEIADFMSITYIAQDIHNLYGDLEGPSDSQVEEQQPPRLQYSMVNEKTCAAITTLLLAFLDQSFEDLVWAVTRLKVHGMTKNDKSFFALAKVRFLLQRLLEWIPIACWSLRFKYASGRAPIFRSPASSRDRF